MPYLTAALKVTVSTYKSRLRIESVQRLIEDRGSTVVKGAALQIGRSLVRFQMVTLEFFIDIILPIALWP